MKAGLFFATLAAAAPAVVTVTQAAPGAVVYVNQYGQPVSTKYPAADPTPAPAPAPKIHVQDDGVSPQVAGHKKHHHKHHHKKHHKHKKGGAAGGNAHPLGITYSPYNADGTCKTQQQVSADFQKISGYDIVRMYGTDCNQASTILAAAQAKGMKVLAGVFDIANVQGEIHTLLGALNGRSDMLHGVSVGNELVNSGLASVSDVVSAIGTARSLLRGAGVNVPVVTVDTFNAVIDNPELCHASDFPAVNAHAFFNPEVSAPNAGKWVKDTIAQVEKACGKLPTVTESGWPHSGSANGAAVPGPAEQQAALSSIRDLYEAEGFADTLFMYTAFDDMWKTSDAATFSAEQYWGFLGTD